MSLISDNKGVPVDYAMIEGIQGPSDKPVETNGVKKPRVFGTKSAWRMLIMDKAGATQQVAIKLGKDGALFPTKADAIKAGGNSWNFTVVKVGYKDKDGKLVTGYVRVNDYSLDRLDIKASEVRSAIKKNRVEALINSKVSDVLKEPISAQKQPRPLKSALKKAEKKPSQSRSVSFNERVEFDDKTTKATKGLTAPVKPIDKGGAETPVRSKLIVSPSPTTTGTSMTPAGRRSLTASEAKAAASFINIVAANLRVFTEEERGDLFDIYMKHDIGTPGTQLTTAFLDDVRGFLNTIPEERKDEILSQLEGASKAKRPEVEVTLVTQRGLIEVASELADAFIGIPDNEFEGNISKADDKFIKDLAKKWTRDPASLKLDDGIRPELKNIAAKLEKMVEAKKNRIMAHAELKKSPLTEKEVEGVKGQQQLARNITKDKEIRAGLVKLLDAIIDDSKGVKGLGDAKALASWQAVKAGVQAQTPGRFLTDKDVKDYLKLIEAKLGDQLAGMPKIKVYLRNVSELLSPEVKQGKVHYAFTKEQIRKQTADVLHERALSGLMSLLDETLKPEASGDQKALKAFRHSLNQGVGYTGDLNRFENLYAKVRHKTPISDAEILELTKLLEKGLTQGISFLGTGAFKTPTQELKDDIKTLIGEVRADIRLKESVNKTSTAIVLPKGMKAEVEARLRTKEAVNILHHEAVSKLGKLLDAADKTSRIGDGYSLVQALERSKNNYGLMVFKQIRDKIEQGDPVAEDAIKEALTVIERGMTAPLNAIMAEPEHPMPFKIDVGINEIKELLAAKQNPDVDKVLARQQRMDAIQQGGVERKTSRGKVIADEPVAKLVAARAEKLAAADKKGKDILQNGKLIVGYVRGFRGNLLKPGSGVKDFFESNIVAADYERMQELANKASESEITLDDVEELKGYLEGVLAGWLEKRERKGFPKDGSEKAAAIIKRYFNHLSELLAKREELTK